MTRPGAPTHIGDAAGEPAATVLSYGMGVDSTAILLRWLAEPDLAPDLDRLVVLTAMTGDEWADTRCLLDTHIIPRLRDAAIRWVQVARAGQSTRDGIVVLDDSRHPTRVRLEGGPWRLSDELRTAGTVPQVASGRRLCSIRAKGEPLDAWMDTHLTGPFNHVLGFNADEIRRAQRDVSYARPGRHSRYPLIEWGWDRATCEDYMADTVGEPWSRSCCTYCPFAGSAGGIDDLIERYRRHPDAALDALLLEHTARALNPQMRLFGARALSDELRPVWPEILARFADHLDTRPWSLYRIRRIVHAARSDPARKGPAWRSVITLATGSADSIRAQLHRHARSVGVFVEPGEPARAWLQRRAATFPATEEFLVAAPAGVGAKQRPHFERWWQRLVTDTQLELFTPNHRWHVCGAPGPPQLSATARRQRHHD